MTVYAYDIPDNYITTRMLCTQLGVSTYWVNKHLHSLGISAEKLIKDARTKDQTSYTYSRESLNKIGSAITSILYDKTKIVNWINSTAICTRQSIYIDILKYTSIEKISRYYQDIEKPDYNSSALEKYEYKVKCAEAYWGLLSDTFRRSASDLCVTPRTRTKMEKIKVNFNLENLDDIKDAPKQSKKYELNYRWAVSTGSVTMKLMGRTYFVNDQHNTLKTLSWRSGYMPDFNNPPNSLPVLLRYDTYLAATGEVPDISQIVCRDECNDDNGA